MGEEIPSLFCSCGSMATAVLKIDDIDSGKEIVIRACVRCHPKTCEMIDAVRLFEKGIGDKPSFTPDELIATLEKEEEKSYPRNMRAREEKEREYRKKEEEEYRLRLSKKGIPRCVVAI